jgi:hypothetical protein
MYELDRQEVYLLDAVDNATIGIVWHVENGEEVWDWVPDGRPDLSYLERTVLNGLLKSGCFEHVTRDDAARGSYKGMRLTDYARASLAASVRRLAAIDAERGHRDPSIGHLTP